VAPRSEHLLYPSDHPIREYVCARKWRRKIATFLRPGQVDRASGSRKQVRYASSAPLVASGAPRGSPEPTDWTREFLTHGVKPDWLCVCSDETVGDLEGAFVGEVYDLGLPTHTDPKEIAAFLRAQDRRAVRAAAGRAAVPRTCLLVRRQRQAQVQRMGL
jgi:hypothetical protein